MFKHPSITYAYHFLSEAIIIFLFAIPIFHLHYEWVPYWSYLLIIGCITIVHTIIFSKAKNALLYLLLLPLFICVFIVSSYPMLMSVLLSVLLVWRAVNIQKSVDNHLQREHKYVIITLALITFIIIFFNDLEIIVFASAQLLILIAGYIFSHLLAMKKEERNYIGQKFWLLLTGFFIIGTIALYPILFVGRIVLIEGKNFFLNSFAFTAEKVGNLLSIVEPKRVPSGVSNEDEMPGEGGHGDVITQNIGTTLVDVLVPIIIVIFILAAIGILIFIGIKLANQRSRKDLLNINESGGKRTTIHKDYAMNIKRSRVGFQRPRFLRKRIHPIRQVVYNFERDVMKLGYGRLPFETIENWFNRLDFSAEHLNIYQAKRYGSNEVDEDEVQELKDTLRLLKRTLNDRIKDIEKGDM